MQFDGTKEELIKEINNCIKKHKEYDTSFWDENPDYDDQHGSEKRLNYKINN